MVESISIARLVAQAGQGLWRWWRPQTSVAAMEARAAELAAAVLSLETPRLEQLGVSRGSAIDTSYRALNTVSYAGGADTGTLSHVATYFRELDPGRMVILGAPGSGKTVLVLNLLLDLLDNRPKGRGVVTLVPIRVNASGWETERLSFSEWLARVLASDYSVRLHLGRRLIAGGWILPILDGLDEMDPIAEPPRRARAAIDQLNRPPWRALPVVVVCRTNRYHELRKLSPHGKDAGLYAATAVTIRPLGPPQIREHLARARRAEGLPSSPWALITETLTTDQGGPLAQTLSSPWFLSLTITRLRHAGGVDVASELVAFKTATALRSYLLATLIPSAVEAVTSDAVAARYAPVEIHTWLRGLAVHQEAQKAHSQRGSDIALHELWKMSSRVSRGLHVCAAVVALEMALALSYVLVLVSTSADTGDLEVLPWILVIGLTFGLLLGLGPALSTSTKPNRLGLRPPRLRHLAFGLATALAAGLLVGVRAGTGAALAIGTSVGALLGLIFWLVDDPMPTVGRQAAITDDYKAGLVVAMGLILAGCGIPTLVSLLAGEALVPSLVGYLVFVIPLGTIVFLTLARAGVRFTCACLALAARRAFPLKALHFMKWARDAGLLRMTGATYQFRHETFRDWILDHPIAAVSTSHRFASAQDSDHS